MPPAMYKIGWAPFVYCRTSGRVSIFSRYAYAFPSPTQSPTRAVKHRPLHDDRLRAVAIDHEPSTRRRVQLGAMDRSDDRLLAIHVFVDPRRDEAATLDWLPDLAVLLDEGDVVSGLSDFAC